MNKKRHVTTDFPAERLPREVLGTIDPSHEVTVIVEDRPSASGRPSSAETIRKHFGAAKEYQTSIADAVARIRHMRDEWD